MATQTTTRKRGAAVESNMAKPWKPKKKGDELQGTYKGAETVPGKGKRPDFLSYHIEQDDGETVRVASAMLNTKMNQVPRGTYLWLKFVGMFETDNGESADYELTLEEGTELIDPLADKE